MNNLNTNASAGLLLKAYNTAKSLILVESDPHFYTLLIDGKKVELPDDYHEDDSLTRAADDIAKNCPPHWKLEIDWAKKFPELDDLEDDVRLAVEGRAWRLR